MKNQKWVVRIIAVFAAVIFLASAALLYFRYPRQVAMEASASTQEFVVGIENPTNKSHWPMNTYIPVRAYGRGSRPIQKLELWINSVLVETYTPDPPLVIALSTWTWVPGEEGDFYLVVRAVDDQGNTVSSKPVRVTAIAAAGFNRLVEISPENNLAELAAQYEVSEEQVRQANPTFDFDHIPDGKSQIFVPIPPVIPAGYPAVPPARYGTEVEEQALIGAQAATGLAPGLQPSGGGEDPAGIEESESSKAEVDSQVDEPGHGEPLPDHSGDKYAQLPAVEIFPELDFEESFDLPDMDLQEPDTTGQQAANPSDPSRAPQAPQISAGYWHCGITIRISEVNNENGLYVYMSSSNSPGSFQRIKTLEADQTHSYFEARFSGRAYYYVTAFNEMGESEPSNVDNVEVPEGHSCARLNNDGLVYQDGKITMPEGMDLAYFYVSVEQGPWERVPANQNEYLPAGTGTFDLHAYITEHQDLLDKFGALKSCYNYQLELWAWDGDALLFLGRDFWDMNCFTNLMVCDRNASGENACTKEAAGYLKTSTFVSYSSAYSKRQFYYEVDFYSQADTVMWFLTSGAPFTETGSTLLSMGKQPVSDSAASNGSFTIDFRTIVEEEESGGSWLDAVEEAVDSLDGNDSDAQPLPAGTYYLIVVPQRGAQMVDVSNTVTIEIGDPGEIERVTPAVHAPNIYDIEFSLYQEPDFPTTELWGCVIITQSNNSDFPVGATICPQTPSNGDQSLLEQLEAIGGAILEGWDWLANGYEWLKAQVAEIVAEFINFFKSGTCGDQCKDKIAKVIGAGIKYLTGLPSKLPTTDELKEEGIAYAVDYTVDYMAEEIELLGEVCETECREKLTELATKAIQDKIRAEQAGAACVSAETAFARYGKVPFCLPPGVESVPVRNGALAPGTILVHVTRKDNPQTNHLTQAEAGNYSVKVISESVNDYWLGKFVTYCRYASPWTPPVGYEPAFDDYHHEIKESLTGPQYEKVEMPIPWLQPGESVDLLIPLTISPGFVIARGHILPPNAQEFVGGNCEHNGWDHMYLYYGGMTTLTADVMCLDGDGKMNYCGATDVKEIVNPAPPY